MNSNSQFSNRSFLRLYQIIGDARRNVQPLIPVSRSTWWQGVRDGRFPKGIKLGSRTTVWRSIDIEALLNGGEVRYGK